MRFMDWFRSRSSRPGTSPADSPMPTHPVVQDTSSIAAEAGGAIVSTSIRGLVVRGDLAGVRLALERGESVDSVDADGCSTLFIAAQEGQTEIVQHLLGSGANPNLCNRNDIPPLNQACAFGHEASAELLVSAGARVNAYDDQGLTALHNAAGMGHLAIVRLLVESGAGLTARTTAGQSAVDLASQRGHPLVVDYLRRCDRG